MQGREIKKIKYYMDGALAGTLTTLAWSVNNLNKKEKKVV